MSPEVHNRGVSGPHKKDLFPPRIFKNKIVNFIDKSQCLYLVHNEGSLVFIFEDARKTFYHGHPKEQQKSAIEVFPKWKENLVNI